MSNVPQLEKETEIIVGSQPAQIRRLEKMSEPDRLCDKYNMEKVISVIIANTWRQTVETVGIPVEEEPKDNDPKHEVVTDVIDPDFFIADLVDVTERKLSQSETINNAVGEAIKTKKAAEELEEMHDPYLLAGTDLYPSSLRYSAIWA